MSLRTFVTAAAVLGAIFAGGQPAHAQERVDFTTSFAFDANGKTFPAGKYFLLVQDAERLVSLQAPDPKAGGVLMAVQTRIAERDRLENPLVVFDKVGDKYYIAEFMVPGEDGIVLHLTGAMHTHATVTGARAKK